MVLGTRSEAKFEKVPSTNLDPFGPFQTKMIFLPQMDKVGFDRGASEQNINYFFEMVQKGPDGPIRVTHDQKHLG